MVTSTMQYNSSKVPMPMDTLELYMTPTCGMVKEGFQLMPLPSKHIVFLPCPFLEKNIHRKLPRCTPTKTGYLCWTKKIPPTIKVICPDCTYGLMYHHTVDPDFFKYAISTTFPIVNSQECNHRNFRNSPKAYTPLVNQKLKQKLHQLKQQKNLPKILPCKHKQPYR